MSLRQGCRKSLSGGGQRTRGRLPRWPSRHGPAYFAGRDRRGHRFPERRDAAGGEPGGLLAALEAVDPAGLVPRESSAAVHSISAVAAAAASAAALVFCGRFRPSIGARWFVDCRCFAVEKSSAAGQEASAVRRQESADVSAGCIDGMAGFSKLSSAGSAELKARRRRLRQMKGERKLFY